MKVVQQDLYQMREQFRSTSTTETQRRWWTGQIWEIAVGVISSGAGFQDKSSSGE